MTDEHSSIKHRFREWSPLNLIDTLLLCCKQSGHVATSDITAACGLDHWFHIICYSHSVETKIDRKRKFMNLQSYPNVQIPAWQEYLRRKFGSFDLKWCICIGKALFRGVKFIYTLISSNFGFVWWAGGKGRMKRKGFSLKNWRNIEFKGDEQFILPIKTVSLSGLPDRIRIESTMYSS